MQSMWPGYQEKPLEMDFCKKEEGIHRGIHAVMHLIEDHAARHGSPVRFAASKVMEGDEKILERLKLTDNEKRILDEIARQTEERQEWTERPQWPKCGSTSRRGLFPRR